MLPHSTPFFVCGPATDGQLQVRRMALACDDAQLAQGRQLRQHRGHPVPWLDELDDLHVSKAPPLQQLLEAPWRVAGTAEPQPPGQGPGLQRRQAPDTPQQRRAQRLLLLAGMSSLDPSSSGR